MRLEAEAEGRGGANSQPKERVLGTREALLSDSECTCNLSVRVRKGKKGYRWVYGPWAEPWKTEESGRPCSV
jgi:hypothetical protein